MGPAKVDLDSDFVQSTIKQANETLESCRKLIAHNDHFKKSKDGYVVNIAWALTIADHVRQQQDRIQVCFHRANFILQRTAEDRLVRNQELMQEDSRAGHDETHRLLRDLQPSRSGQVVAEQSSFTLLSPDIAERIAQSYLAASSDVAPTISQRLDAVRSFYDRGTQMFEAEKPLIICPSPVQYLNLLKCIWLLHHIKNDQALRSYSKDPFNAAYVRSLDRKVDAEAQRFLLGEHQLQRVSDDQLLRQDAAAFSVCFWTAVTVPMPGPLEVNGGEILLMSTVLRARDQSSVEEIKVFGIAEGRLRLARATTRSAQLQHVDTTVHEREVDSRKVFLSPIYAMTLNAAPSIIWKPTTSDQIVQELSFTTLDDARKFQALVTGFGVVCDEPAFLGAKKKAGLLDGQGRTIARAGRIQIWMHRNPFVAAAVQSATPSSPSGGSQLTRSSTGSAALTNTSHSTWTETEFKSKHGFTTIRSGEGGAFLSEPVPAQVIILTEVDDKKRVITIPITEHTQLAPDKCRCSSKNSQCQEVIVESNRGKIKIRTSRVHSQNEGWNIAVFGQPMHHDLKQTEEESVKYVSLQFRSVMARKNFAETAQMACNIIKNRMDAYHRDLKRTKEENLYIAK